jgi:hypothetical protein
MTTPSAPRLGKQLRRANQLLRDAERVFHDLPDHHCPRLLLERIQLHLAKDQPPPGEAECPKN